MRAVLGSEPPSELPREEVWVFRRRQAKGRLDPKQVPTRLRPAWPKNGWAAGLIILAITLAGLLHVRAKHTLVQLGYALSQAARENEQLILDQRKLQIEVATLCNPSRLRKLSAEVLGLTEPTAAQIILLNGAERGKLAMQGKKQR